MTRDFARGPPDVARRTCGVVARRQGLGVLIGRLLRQPLDVAGGGFVRLLVLDENFAHQLLRTGQRYARLQLESNRDEYMKQKPLKNFFFFFLPIFFLCMYKNFLPCICPAGQSVRPPQRSIDNIPPF